MESSADKEGLQSAGRKEQSSRHGAESSPGVSPVPGAYGREGLDREGEGKPVVPSSHEEEELDDDELDFDEDDLDLDDDITDEEAERADGA